MWYMSDVVVVLPFEPVMQIAVVLLLPLYVVVVEHLLVLVLYLRHVRDKHVEAFLFRQHGGSRAALAST